MSLQPHPCAHPRCALQCSELGALGIPSVCPTSPSPLASSHQHFGHQFCPFGHGFCPSALYLCPPVPVCVLPFPPCHTRPEGVDVTSPTCDTRGDRTPPPSVTPPKPVISIFLGFPLFPLFLRRCRGSPGVTPNLCHPPPREGLLGVIPHPGDVPWVDFGDITSGFGGREPQSRGSAPCPPPPALGGCSPSGGMGGRALGGTGARQTDALDVVV